MSGGDVGQPDHLRADPFAVHAVNPPLDVRSNLNGTFTYMTVMPKQTNILVVATGTPAIQWPSGGGVGPVLVPNVHLRMVLDSEWKSGTAYYGHGSP
ncbi:DUF1842 domain-containing protein [Hyalangium rubrum]|uniref:DUF1842 domain-containing protein n=1 Tax=Hyalangium rubrum TaxID=3103134 RepID=A0ABU5HH74_9BACT|nr:DUF1842 domain-containing protein [Hyalangium sp. s54d21]MDY7232823.1 DUF1842 domain-containing protein [Hyalangium sp. s54d21]